MGLDPEPISSGDAFAEFLRATGGGVMALVHRASDGAALDADIARLRGLCLSRGSQIRLDTS